MWNTLFWIWISSKNLQKLKNTLQKNFLSVLVTKLENIFFGKNLWKISSNWWFQKKLLTDLTSARTLKVCYSIKISVMSYWTLIILLFIWTAKIPNIWNNLNEMFQWCAAAVGRIWQQFVAFIKTRGNNIKKYYKKL